MINGVSMSSTTISTAQRRTLSRSRIIAAFAAAFVAAFLFGFVPSAANAGTANSATGTFTTNGVGYQNYASVRTSTGSAIAYTYTGPRSTSVASGWVGSRGRLFTGGGALSCEGANSFSSVTLGAGAYWSGTSCTRGGSGNWYSYGVSSTYTGSGYATTYTFQSPQQSS
jgi:hypothetical protein